MRTQLDTASLYAKYGPVIFARCKRLLKNSAAAEDATQDVFIKVMRHAEKAPAADAVLPWVHRIATNHCLNVLRDGRRQAEPVSQVPELVDDEFEETLLSRDFSRCLLARTPEHVKAPAVLFHAQGLEQAKVAQELGVSRRTVLYRLSEFTDRAMKLQRIVEA